MEPPVKDDNESLSDAELVRHRADHARLTRRQLIAGGGVTAAAAVGVAGYFVARDEELFGSSSETPAQSVTNSTTNTLPQNVQYKEVPNTPDLAPNPALLRFFTPHEALTVDALTSRILPGSPDDPGAHEAGVVTYIDNFLASRDGFPEPTYRTAPYAQTYEGDGSSATPVASPAATPDASPGATPEAGQPVMVAGDQVERYGYQSILTPPQVYRIGVASVDRYAKASFGKAFVDLNPDQQDQIVGDMADGKATGFDAGLSGAAFFKNLRRHTGEGMFSDPLYGGNQNLIGWKLIGHPGAQRAYNPADIRNPNFYRAPQSIADMMRFMPGMKTDPDVILPVSGSTEGGSGK